MRLAAAIFIAAAISIALIAAPPATAKKKDAKKTQAAVPQSIVGDIAAGDLSTAVIALREEPASPKINYLIREASRIAMSEMEGKPRRSEAHNYYQNLAISYHNLYLFLKARGIENQDYFDEARRYYKKARRAGTILHKAECSLLTAALYASSGECEKAKKMASKIDEFMLRSDFESMEYLAAYHAAMGDAQAAIAALRAAYELNPSRTLAWVEVGDDFYKIEDKPCFGAAVAELKKAHRGRDLKLTVPCEPEPKLDMTGGRL